MHNTQPYQYTVKAKAFLRGTTLLEAENLDDNEINQNVRKKSKFA